MRSTAIRSCLSRSLLHSLLWCEPKHQGQGLVGCPGSGSELLWQSQCVVFKSGDQTEASWPLRLLAFLQGDLGYQANQFLSLKFSPSIRRVALGILAMSPAPPTPRGASSNFVALVLHLDHWSDCRSNWATLSISFMSWQGYHVIT